MSRFRPGLRCGLAPAVLLLGLVAPGAWAVDLSGLYAIQVFFTPPCPLVVRQTGTQIELDPAGEVCWLGVWDGVATGTVDPSTGVFSASGFTCESLESTVSGSGDGLDLRGAIECGSFPALIFGTKCGNGLVEPEESCDDGGTRTGDGCSNRCEVESGWVCMGEPSLCALLPSPTPTPTVQPTPTVTATPEPPAKKKKLKKGKKKKDKKNKKGKKGKGKKKSKSTGAPVLPPPGVGELVRRTVAVPAICRDGPLEAPDELVMVDLTVPVAVTPGEVLRIRVEDLRSSFFAPDDLDTEEIFAFWRTDQLDRATGARRQPGGLATYGPHESIHVAVGPPGEQAVIGLGEIVKERPNGSLVVCEPRAGGVWARIPIVERTLEVIDQRHDLYFPATGSSIALTGPVGQEFRPEGDALDFVDLYTRDFDQSPADGRRTVNIRRDTIFGPLLGSAGAILPNDFVGSTRFSFPRIDLVPDERYVIEVVSEGPNWGVLSSGDPGSPLYTRGHRISRGEQGPADLWFRLGTLLPRAEPGPSKVRRKKSVRSRKHKTKQRQR